MLNEFYDLFLTQGCRQYGQEAVSQLEHGLQCAALAEGHQATPDLIVACLLHDLGHLIHPLGEDCAKRGLDDRHEYRALKALSPYFPPGVTEPIRLHVEAKRYLCATEAAYGESLSPASQHSLTLQGGSFSPERAQAFARQPYAMDAIQLRRWDDQAKVPHHPTPDLAHFWAIVSRVKV